jgi:hypothetical protein
MVGGAATREEAEEYEKEIRKIAGEDAQAAFDTGTKTWGLSVVAIRSREEAVELRAGLEAAGLDASVEGPAAISAQATAPSA